jgi:hypothetical protein
MLFGDDRVSGLTDAVNSYSVAIALEDLAC